MLTVAASRKERFASAPTIHDHVEQLHRLVSGNSRQVAYDGLSELVRELGIAFRPVGWQQLGETPQRGKANECFKNSYRLATDYPQQWAYVEGLAWSGLLPVHHSWLVNPQDEVLDPTWDERSLDQLPVERWEYVGVPLSVEFVFQTSERRRVYGVFDESRLFREPLPPSAIHPWFRGEAR